MTRRAGRLLGETDVDEQGPGRPSGWQGQTKAGTMVPHGEDMQHVQRHWHSMTGRAVRRALMLHDPQEDQRGGWLHCPSLPVRGHGDVRSQPRAQSALRRARAAAEGGDRRPTLGRQSHLSHSDPHLPPRMAGSTTHHPHPWRSDSNLGPSQHGLVGAWGGYRPVRPGLCLGHPGGRAWLKLKSGALS